jgi:hypothetical protein
MGELCIALCVVAGAGFGAYRIGVSRRSAVKNGTFEARFGEIQTASSHAIFRGANRTFGLITS